MSIRNIANQYPQIFRKKILTAESRLVDGTTIRERLTNETIECCTWEAFVDYVGTDVLWQYGIVNCDEERLKTLVARFVKTHAELFVQSQSDNYYVNAIRDFHLLPQPLQQAYHQMIQTIAEAQIATDLPNKERQVAKAKSCLDQAIRDKHSLEEEKNHISVQNLTAELGILINERDRLSMQQAFVRCPSESIARLDRLIKIEQDEFSIINDKIQRKSNEAGQLRAQIEKQRKRAAWEIEYVQMTQKIQTVNEAELHQKIASLENTPVQGLRAANRAISEKDGYQQKLTELDGWRRQHKWLEDQIRQIPSGNFSAQYDRLIAEINALSLQRQNIEIRLSSYQCERAPLLKQKMDYEALLANLAHAQNSIERKQSEIIRAQNQLSSLRDAMITATAEEEQQQMALAAACDSFANARSDLATAIREAQNTFLSLITRQQIGN